MIRVFNLEDERLLYGILSPDLPQHVKDLIYDAIEEFEEKRAI